MKSVLLLSLLFASLPAEDLKMASHGGEVSIDLPGRDPVYLPISVVAVKTVKNVDQNKWLLLLYRKRTNQPDKNDFHGLLAISKMENGDWEVREYLTCINLREKTGCSKVYISDVDSITNFDDVSIQLTFPEDRGGVTWQRWNLVKEEKIEEVEAPVKK